MSEEARKKYVVVSYREDYVQRCPRGCCREGGIGSAFALTLVDSLDGAARWIAQQIRQDPGAEYVHHVLGSWEDCLAMGWHSSCNPEPGADSVKITEDPWDDYDDISEERNLARNQMVTGVRNAVKRYLDDFEAESKRAEAEKSRKEEERRRAEREAAERKQYEALRKKFEDS